ncbi:MAG TPA: Xaa-Pro peptidase family protein [Candidatus Limnocylindrales bacterium]|nr:Xaa-Pro peptidase family protein [Candidatus Limnocylindrales bacterium]
MTGVLGGPGRRPDPADFAPPPDAATRLRWTEADRANRPSRLERLRARMAAGGVDAYFGVRPEHMRWITGFALGNGEEKVAGHSGQFLVGGDEVILVTDSRYTIQARREAPDATVDEIGYSLPDAWPRLLARLGARRVALESAVVPHELWTRLEAAAPEVEHVPVDGWIEAMRAEKTPDEIERIAAACAVADRALAALLPEIGPGVTERDLALRLEWLMRTGGAEALAFDVACLSGPEAALPHGAPGDRPVMDRAVLLFDFGAQVEGYRSDMTRTLFVGEPTERDLGVYDVVRRAQQAVVDELASCATAGTLPSGLETDAIARRVIDADGRWPAYGHGLGHGIGLATHELPRQGRTATSDPLPSPTVFSVEPGIYLEGETGVRIEDLVHVDTARALLERLTLFPKDVIVVGSGG